MFGGNSSQGFGGNSTNFQASNNPYVTNSGQNSLNETLTPQPGSGGASNPWSTQQSNIPQSSTQSNAFGSSSFGQSPALFGATSFGTSGFGSSAVTSGGAGQGISLQNATQPPAKLSFAGSFTGNNTTNMQSSSNSGLFGSNNLSKTGGANNHNSSSSSTHTFKCRVCQNSFPTYEELRKHMKAESHFDNTKATPVTSTPSSNFQSTSIGASSAVDKGHTTNPFAAATASGSSLQQQPVSNNVFQAMSSQQPQREVSSVRPPPAVFGAQQSGALRPLTTASAGGSQDVRQHSSGSHARTTLPMSNTSTAVNSSPWAVGPSSSTTGTSKPVEGGPPPTVAGGVGAVYRPPPQRSAPPTLNPHSKPFAPSSLPANNITTATVTTTGVGGVQKNMFGLNSTSNTTGSGKKSSLMLPTTTGLPSGPDTSQPVSDMSGDDGDHNSDADYVPEADNSAQSGDSEEDDLNFSFSSRESGPATTSPVKHTRSKHLHSPAAATAAATVAATGSGVLGQEHRRRNKTTTATATTVAKEQQQQMAITTDDEQGGAMSNDDDQNATGTCEDMCPAAERTKRLNESDIHKLEIPHPDMTPGRSDYSQTMVKKFQRSSADHALQIPHLLRTPEALLRSIEYIETELMDRASRGVLDPRIGEPPSALFIYLFVWDRYRMVAKDFTLQQVVLPLSRTWVECHERMARWFILMDHKMQAAGDFISAGHGQQNGEQLNNLLKTLHGYYFRSPPTTTATSKSATTTATSSSATTTATSKSATTTATSSSGNEETEFEMPNKAEFVCYFVIFQLGNGGEVSKYLQQLPDEILNSQPVRFAIEVWGALKTQNYAKYFRLLRTRATLLQACLMFRYVGEVRLLALKKMARTLNPPGSSAQELPLLDLVRLFMFESTAEAMEFVEHCGLAVLPRSTTTSSGGSMEDTETEWVVPLKGQSIDSLLPRDKNDRPIPPATYYMHESIDRAKSVRSASHQLNAPIGFESHYSIAEISRGFATSTAPPLTAPAPPQVSAAASQVITGNNNVRVRTPLTVPTEPSTTTTGTSNTTTTAATVIDKTALRNKLLMSGTLGSGRGAKPAVSPIAPVNEDDLWGPADFSATTAQQLSGRKKNNISTKARSPVPAVFGSSTTSSNSSSSEPASVGFGTKKTLTPAKLNTFSPSPSASPASATFASASKFGSIDSSTIWRRAGSESDQEGKKNSAVSKKGPFSSEFENPQSQRTQQQQQQQQVNSFSPAISQPAAAVTNPVSAFPFFPSVPPPATTTTTAATTATATTTTDVTTAGPFSLRAAIATTTVPTPSTLPQAATAPAPAALPAEVSFQKPALGSGGASATASAVLPAPRFELPAFTPALPLPPVPVAVQPIEQTPKKVFTAEHPVPVVSTATMVAKTSAPSATPTPKLDVVSTGAPPPPQRPAVNATKLREFEDKQQRRYARKALQAALSNWRRIAETSCATRQIRVTSVYFLFWKQALRRVIRARQTFVADIRATKFTASTTSMEVDFTSLSLVPSMLKRKQTQQEAAEKEVKVLVQNTVKGRYHLLCDFTTSTSTTSANATTPSTTSMNFGSIGIDESDAIKFAIAKDRSKKTILDLVGRTLLSVKHWQVREVLGLPVSVAALEGLCRPLSDPSCSLLTESRQPYYQGTVCFKLAVVSDGHHAGVHSKAEDSVSSVVSITAVNCLRSVLANEAGYGYSASSQQESITKSQSGKMKKRRGQLARALACTEPQSVVRVGLHTHRITPTSTVQLSVVDVCGSESTMKSSELTAQVAAVSSVVGVQGVVVIATVTPSGIDCAASAASFCQVLRASATTVPAVLVIVNTRPSSVTTPTVQEISLTEQQFRTMEGIGVVQETIQALQTAMHHCGFRGGEIVDLLQAGLVLSLPTTTEQVHDQVAMEKLTQAVMARATQLLTATAAPAPLVTCLRTAEWMQVYLTNTDTSIAPTPPAQQLSVAPTEMDVSKLREYCHASFVRCIQHTNAIVAALLALLQELHCSVEQVGAAGFPVMDFTTAPHNSSNSGCSNNNSSSVTTSGLETEHKKSRFLPAAVVSLLQLEGIKESVTWSEQSSTEATASIDALHHLPVDWVARSQYPVLQDLVSQLTLPVWKSHQSISQYQSVLLDFLKHHRAQAPNTSTSINTILSCTTTVRRVHTESLLESLQEVINSAHHSNTLHNVDTALSVIVMNILIERFEACKHCLPTHFYAILHRKHAGVLRDTFSVAETTISADTDVHVNAATMPASLLFSPIAGTAASQSCDRSYRASDAFAQTQHAQAFPTGFGRSLFASFSAAAAVTTTVGTPSGSGGRWGSSPATTPYSHSKTKRAYTEDSKGLNNNNNGVYSDKQPYSEQKESGTAAGETCSSTVDVDALLTAAFKRAKRTSIDPQQQSEDVVYRKQLLFGTPSKTTDRTSMSSTATHTPVPATATTTGTLAAQVQEEQLAAARLTALLQSTLHQQHTPTTTTTGPSVAHTIAAVAADLSDPFSFIEQCRLEREQFTHTSL